MSSLWATLIPLALGGAFVPIQLGLTLLLLRTARGIVKALAFVAGMCVVRLLQGGLFGFIFSSSDSVGGTSSGSGPIVSGILIALAMLMFSAAAKMLLGGQDADAAPPKWMSATERMGTGKAFLLGAGFITVGAKFWVLTLGAIGAIKSSDLSMFTATFVFLGFIFVTSILHLVIIAVAATMPAQSAMVLERCHEWLVKNNRVIVIALGTIFGSWFLIKGINGFT